MKLLELVSHFGGNVLRIVKDNDTRIITGCIVLGVAGTAYLTHKSAIKAYGVIEEAEYTSDHPLSRKEKVGLVWKIYIPPFAAAVATISLAISNQLVNTRRQASLIEAYLMAKTAKEELESKTQEIVGKNKFEKIQEDITKDHVEKNWPSEENIILTPYGDTLCYDELGGTWFKHDIAKLKEGFNAFVERFNNDESLTHEEVYYDVYGFTNNIPKLSALVGWYPGYTNSPQPTYTSIMGPGDVPAFCIKWNLGHEPITNFKQKP